MANIQMQQICEVFENWLAQGVSRLTPADVSAAAAQCASVGLTQPAALLTQLHAQIVQRGVTAQDTDAVMKILRLLFQTDIQLSAAMTIQPDELQPLDGAFDLYRTPAQFAQTAPLPLEDILTLPETWARRHAVAQYVKQAAFAELVFALDLIWFDYDLTQAVVQGLQNRPADALQLAPMAWHDANPVMQHTTLKVLATVGKLPDFQAAALGLLQQFGEKAKSPWRELIAEVSANVEGAAAAQAYQQAKAQRLNAQAETLALLTHGKKGERKKALNALGKTKDPCFVAALSALLEDDDLELVQAAIKTLGQIGGFDALPRLIALTRVQTDHTFLAAEGLYEFREYHGLTYFLSRKFAAPTEKFISYYDYGALLFAPVFAIIKRSPAPPARMKEWFLSLFEACRYSKVTAQALTFLRRDPVLMDKLRPLFEVAYPAYFDKYLRQAAPRDEAAFAAMLDVVFGDRGAKIIAHLKSAYAIHQMELTPDNRRLVVMETRGEVTIWKTATWKKETAFTLAAHPRAPYVHHLALTPDGRELLVTNNHALTVEAITIGDWERRRTVLTHTKEIYTLAVTADTAYLLTGDETTGTVWEWETGRKVAILHGHAHGVEYLHLRPGQPTLISADRMGNIFLWDAATWTKQAEFHVHGLLSSTIALSPDGQYLIAVDQPGSYLKTLVRVWQTADWQELPPFAIAYSSPLVWFTFTPDNRYLVASCPDTVKFLAVGTWEERLTLSGAQAQGLAVSNDARYVIHGGNVWEIDWSNLA